MSHSSGDGGVCRPHGSVIFSFFTLYLIGSKQLLIFSNCILCVGQQILICKYSFLVHIYHLLYCLIAAQCNIIWNWTIQANVKFEAELN